MVVDTETIYVAGHLAPPGRYRRVDPPDARTVVLERDDFLPGSLDGHVACYTKLPEAPPPDFLLKEPVPLGRTRRGATA